jgi:hypothetical protein
MCGRHRVQRGLLQVDCVVQDGLAGKPRVSQEGPSDTPGGAAREAGHIPRIRHSDSSFFIGFHLQNRWRLAPRLSQCPHGGGISGSIGATTDRTQLSPTRVRIRKGGKIYQRAEKRRVGVPR